MKFQKSIGTIIGDEKAIIDRTNLEIYRAIIARTQNSIPDDDFIVHRGDINKPGCYYNAKCYNDNAVRRDFFSHLFHRFENILIDNRAYMLEGEAGTSLSETMYAAGIFFCIAILQEDIYHSATIELLKTGG
jgi:hypothetical protein